MAEIISKERVPYRIWDKINGVWNELKFKTNAKSVDAEDGETLENKVGAIKGITDDLNCEENPENTAVSVKAINDSLGGLTFGKDGDGNCGYYGADGSLIPFKKNSNINIFLTNNNVWTFSSATTKTVSWTNSVISSPAFYVNETDNTKIICDITGKYNLLFSLGLYKSISSNKFEVKVNDVVVKTILSSDVKSESSSCGFSALYNIGEISLSKGDAIQISFYGTNSNQASISGFIAY